MKEWLSRLRDHMEWADTAVIDSLLKQEAAENAAGYRSLLASTDERGLSRGVAYANSKGERFESRLDDILLHVFLHGSYHRGQVAALQRSDGREPLLTDFIHFVRTVRTPGR